MNAGSGSAARWFRGALVPFLQLALTISTSACGGGGGSSSSSTSFPAPFDNAKGEGDVTNAQLVMTYPTGTAAAGDNAAPGDSLAPVPGLDNFYSQLICAGLSQPDCATNTANLDTPEFGNFNLANDPIGNNPLGITAVVAVKVNYVAINVDFAPVTVSGAIVVPEVDPASLKGVILYFHGTTVQRSYFLYNDDCTADLRPRF